MHACNRNPSVYSFVPQHLFGLGVFIGISKITLSPLREQSVFCWRSKIIFCGFLRVYFHSRFAAPLKYVLVVGKQPFLSPAELAASSG